MTLKVIYSVIIDIENVPDEVEFRRQLVDRAKQHFENKDVIFEFGLCYKLLRYVLTTQRHHLFNLHRDDLATIPAPKYSEDEVEEFEIDQVIAVLDHKQAQVDEFNLRKKQFGSVYAYHGTISECLYSLQRNGMRNLSNS